MSPLAVIRAEQRLDALFSKVALLDSDPELQAHWARYLCILVSGYVESAVKAIYSAYAEKKSDPRVRRYSDQCLSQFQNPTMGKILEITRSFDPNWEIELKAFVEGAPKDSVDSIVANRHKIAHGENVGISYATVKGYYENTKRVIHFMGRTFC